MAGWWQMNASPENVPEESKEKATNGEVNGDNRIKLKIKQENVRSFIDAVRYVKQVEYKYI